MPASDANMGVRSGRSLYYGALFLIFCTGYLSVQLFLSDEGRLNEFAGYLRPKVGAWCAKGIRLPGVPCQNFHAELLEQNEDESLTLRFARLPNLGAVLDKLQWNGDSEIDAARFISLFHALVGSRHRESNAERKRQILLLDPFWKDYADLLYASRCIHCGGVHKEILTANLRYVESVPETVLRATYFDPEFTSIAIDKGWITGHRGKEIRGLQGELQYTWDSTVAGQIASVFTAAGDYERLREYAARIGSKALTGLDLVQLPHQIVRGAWERDIEHGEPNVSMTGYLMQTGYRPALRWALWSEADELPYLVTRAWADEKASYLGVIRQHTDFPQLKGRALTEFYSEHWQNIAWNPATRKWTVSKG